MTTEQIKSILDDANVKLFYRSSLGYLEPAYVDRGEYPAIKRIGFSGDPPYAIRTAEAYLGWFNCETTACATRNPRALIWARNPERLTISDVKEFKSNWRVAMIASTALWQDGRLVPFMDGQLAKLTDVVIQANGGVWTKEPIVDELSQAAVNLFPPGTARVFAGGR